MSINITTLAILFDLMEAHEAARNLNQLKNAGRGAESATDSLTDAFKRFAGPAVAVTAVPATLKKTLEMQRLFDTLNASLVTTTGSVANAGQAFQALQAFAATIPYGLQVSIRAQPVGRAMPPPIFFTPTSNSFQSAPSLLAGRCHKSRGTPANIYRFNPRPACWPGDAKALQVLRQNNWVSIRAQPVGRAMQIINERRSRRSRFQSAPSLLAGRCDVHAV